jgi:hypothetical protein
VPATSLRRVWVEHEPESKSEYKASEQNLELKDHQRYLGGPDRMLFRGSDSFSWFYSTGEAGFVWSLKSENHGIEWTALSQEECLGHPPVI